MLTSSFLPDPAGDMRSLHALLLLPARVRAWVTANLPMRSVLRGPADSKAIVSTCAAVRPAAHSQARCALREMPSSNGLANGKDRTVIKTKPRIENNRVLVTGGAGFVGSHLCTFLVEKGDHVRISLY